MMRKTNKTFIWPLPIEERRLAYNVGGSNKFYVYKGGYVWDVFGHHTPLTSFVEGRWHRVPAAKSKVNLVA